MKFSIFLCHIFEHQIVADDRSHHLEECKNKIIQNGNPFEI